MKNPLQSLLILLALGLCGLCTWQWQSQVQQNKQMNALAQTNYDQTVAIQGYTNSISNMDHQIAQMDARITDLRDTIHSNSTELTTLRQENVRLTSFVDQYSNAVAVLQEQIKIANDNIRRQNDAMKGLVAERDDYVTRLNESIKERNEVVTQYNDLVKKVEEMQAPKSKK